jgi:hypothetical protein
VDALGLAKIEELGATSKSDRRTSFPFSFVASLQKMTEATNTYDGLLG